MGSSTEHNLGYIKENARLYAYISPIPVSNGAGFGTVPYMCRKNASCRNSTVSKDDIDFTSGGSVIASRLSSPMVGPIPTEIIVWASSKNSSVVFTGKGCRLHAQSYPFG